MKKGEHRINWTDEENAFVRQHGPHFARVMLQRELNLKFGHDRSLQAVKHQCCVLKVKSEVIHRKGGARIVKWTPREDAILKKLAGKKPVEEVAARLGRTPWSLKTRAVKLRVSWKVAYDRMSISEAVQKALTARQTFMKAVSRVGAQIHTVNPVRKEISDEDFRRVKAYLDEAKTRRKPPPKPKDAPKLPKVAKSKPKFTSKRDAKVEVELIRQRHVVWKAKEYFKKMKDLKAIVSQVEILRKSGAAATIEKGMVIGTTDGDLIDEAALATGYWKVKEQQHILYRP